MLAYSNMQLAGFAFAIVYGVIIFLIIGGIGYYKAKAFDTNPALRGIKSRRR